MAGWGGPSIWYWGLAFKAPGHEGKEDPLRDLDLGFRVWRFGFRALLFLHMDIPRPHTE